MRLPAAVWRLAAGSDLSAKKCALAQRYAPVSLDQSARPLAELNLEISFELANSISLARKKNAIDAAAARETLQIILQASRFDKKMAKLAETVSRASARSDASRSKKAGKMRGDSNRKLYTQRRGVEGFSPLIPIRHTSPY